MKTTFKTLKLTIAVLTALTVNATLTFGQTGTKLPLSVTVQATNPTCNGYNDGQLFFTVSGGFPPYYLNGLALTSDTVSLTSLSEGTYDFTFTDESLAMSEGTAVLFAPQAPSIIALVNDVTALTPNGSIDLTVVSTYGVVGYEWQSLNPVNWNPIDEDQYGLAAGDYVVTITETNGCQFTKRFDVSDMSGGGTSNYIITNNPVNVESSSMVLFPNPSSGNFQIKTEQSLNKVIINDQLGQVMILDESPEATKTYELKPGNYIVTGIDTDNNTTRSNITIR
jgi:hypothetical protein